MAVYLPSADKPVPVEIETTVVEAEVIVPAEENQPETIDYKKYWEEDFNEEQEEVIEHNRFQRQERREGNRDLLMSSLLISGDSANTEVVTLRKKIEAILEDTQEMRNLEPIVLSFSPGNGKLPMGGAVLVWEHEGVKNFYSFLIEGSQSQKKEWFTQVGEYFDGAAIEEVKRLIGGESKEIGYCSLTIEEITEQESASILRTAVVYALNSLWSRIEKPVRLNPDMMGHAVVVAPKEFPDGHSYNAIGRPVRTDFQLDMKVKDRNATHRVASPKFWVDLGIDDGFLQPVVRLSDLGDLASYSLENILLAVAGVAICNLDEDWVSAFRIRKYNKMNDLAGLGYFIDDKKAECKSMAYGDEYDELLDITCHHQAYLAIDVPEASPLTWLTRHFARAARVDAGSEEAFDSHDLIREAANHLTGGHFDSVLAGDNIPFVFEGYRSLTGFYVDKSGENRSLDDVDIISLANSSKEDTSSIEWGQTADRWVASEEERLIYREKLIKSLLPGAKLTGMTRVVYFNPDFIEVLLIALRREGVSFIHDEGQRPAGRHARFNPSFIRGLERMSAGKVNRIF